MTKKDRVEQKIKIREQNETFRRLLEEALTALRMDPDRYFSHLADRIENALTRKP